ncbi:MAG: hypothetical protein E7459_00255 [Ruminococcaceae bacterium]|nr:hypothetical protein [Oscillospiraceae bacterium]
MKNKWLWAVLSLLLIPALLLSGCRRNPTGEDQATTPSGSVAPTETGTLAENEEPEETKKTTLPETRPTENPSGMQNIQEGQPYEVLSLDSAGVVLLYDGNCNYDVYHDGTSSGVFLYELTLLSRNPLDQNVVMMSAAEISAYQCALEDMTDLLYDELEEHPYLHATALGLDAQRAVSLYHAWLQAHEQYMQTRSAEDFEARKAARDAYDDYLGTDDIPELPYYAYRLTLTASQFWGQAEAVIRNLEIRLGQEWHTLAIGEIRAHDIRSGELSQEQAVSINRPEYARYGVPLSDTLIAYSGQIAFTNRQTGQLEASIVLYALEKSTLNKLEILGNNPATITDIRVEHEAGADGHMQPWTGDAPITLEADTIVTITAQLELGDVRLLNNPVYHGAVNCALHYEAETGLAMTIFGMAIRPEPDYLALCALHLDGINLNVAEGRGGAM